MKPRKVHIFPIVAAFAIPAIYIYIQTQEIRSLNNAVSNMEFENSELREENDELNSRIASYESENEALKARTEELSLYLNYSINQNKSGNMSFSRYIKLADGTTQYITVTGTDNIITFLNSNFCMHQPSKLY